jgi:sulfopyruvate decarboxylase alpha subunit
LDPAHYSGGSERTRPTPAGPLRRTRPTATWAGPVRGARPRTSYRCRGPGSISIIPRVPDELVAQSIWARDIYHALKQSNIGQVAYVPDAGHKELIELCHGDAAMRTVPLTTEEEGVALVAGGWLGGARGALLMQSSGVGNCINMLSLIEECRFPLLLLVTMRGQWGETNPWQVPMGQNTARVLEHSGVIVQQVDSAGELGPSVAAAAQMAFVSSRAVALLIGQRVIGAKKFEERS